MNASTASATHHVHALGHFIWLGVVLKLHVRHETQRVRGNKQSAWAQAHAGVQVAEEEVLEVLLRWGPEVLSPQGLRAGLSEEVRVGDLAHWCRAVVQQGCKKGERGLQIANITCHGND